MSDSGESEMSEFNVLCVNYFGVKQNLNVSLSVICWSQCEGPWRSHH